MNKVELTDLEWFVKVNEHLSITLHNISNGVSPTEEQIEVMRALYNVCYDGALPLYKNSSQTRDDILSQGLLFSTDTTADKKDGTDIDNEK